MRRGRDVIDLLKRESSAGGIRSGEWIRVGPGVVVMGIVPGRSSHALDKEPGRVRGKRHGGFGMIYGFVGNVGSGVCGEFKRILFGVILDSVQGKLIRIDRLDCGYERSARRVVVDGGNVPHRGQFRVAPKMVWFDAPLVIVHGDILGHHCLERDRILVQFTDLNLFQCETDIFRVETRLYRSGSTHVGNEKFKAQARAPDGKVVPLTIAGDDAIQQVQDRWRELVGGATGQQQTVNLCQ